MAFNNYEELVKATSFYEDNVIQSYLRNMVSSWRVF